VVVTHELNEVEVSCLPKDLPEYLEIDLSALNIGDIVHLSEIKLPAGVEIPELKLGKEHDVAIVIAKHGREEVEETTEAPAADVPAAKVAKKDEDKK
jgi:large subunit ribosomal protein L25